MNNKYLIKNLILLLATIAFSSCEKTEIQDPIAQIRLSSTEAFVNEPIEFWFEGVAEQVALFTGDAEHVYGDTTSENVAVVMNKNWYSYSYRKSGNYTVMVIASTYGDYGSNLKVDTTSINITIKADPNAQIIKMISCPYIIYDEVFAIAHEDDWLLGLPYKALYNDRAITISANQKMSIHVGVDSAEVFINDQAFSVTEKYALEEKQVVRVDLASGEQMLSDLYMLRIPEFKNFSIGGNEAEILRNDFNYYRMELHIEQADSIDLSNLAPIFELQDARTKVFYAGEEISSGTSIDFSQPVEFTLKLNVEGRDDLMLSTKITAIVTTI